MDSTYAALIALHEIAQDTSDDERAHEQRDAGADGALLAHYYAELRAGRSI